MPAPRHCGRLRDWHRLEECGCTPSLSDHRVATVRNGWSCQPPRAPRGRDCFVERRLATGSRKIRSCGQNEITVEVPAFATGPSMRNLDNGNVVLAACSWCALYAAKCGQRCTVPRLASSVPSPPAVRCAGYFIAAWPVRTSKLHDASRNREPAERLPDSSPDSGIGQARVARSSSVAGWSQSSGWPRTPAPLSIAHCTCRLERHGPPMAETHAAFGGYAAKAGCTSARSSCGLAALERLPSFAADTASYRASFGRRLVEP